MDNYLIEELQLRLAELSAQNEALEQELVFYRLAGDAETVKQVKEWREAQEQQRVLSRLRLRDWF